MAAWKKVKPGTTVTLLDPLCEFEGIRPNPVPMGTRGAVADNLEAGMLQVDWDTGYSSKVHRRAVRVERGA